MDKLLEQLAAARGVETPDETTITRRVCGCEFSFKAAQPDDSPAVLMWIEGYASTSDIDDYNEVVLPTAFADTMDSFMQFPLMLFGHDWYSLPIGKWTEYKIDSHGLWLRGFILKTAVGGDVALLIDSKVLRALSIGFSPLTVTRPEKEGDPTIIEKLRLWEVSIVNVPANRAALFEQAKQRGLQLKSIQPESAPRAGGNKTRSRIMDADVKEVTDRLANVETSAERALSKIGEMENKTQRASEIIQQLGEKFSRLEKGQISSAEFKEFQEGVKADFLALKTEVEKSQKAVTMFADRPAPRDLVLRNVNPAPWTDDNGNPLPEEKVRLLELLTAEVAPDGSSEYEQLKALRNAADDLVLEDCWRQAKRKNRPYRGAAKECKTWSRYIKLLRQVDPVMCKGIMNTEDADLGTEWVPTGFGGLLFDEVRMEGVVADKIPIFTMSTPVQNWPISTSRPKSYRMPQATVVNAQRLQATSFGTGAPQFSVETFGCGVPFSSQIEEDAFLGFLVECKALMARGIASDRDSWILNGDTTATHRDTQRGWTSLNMETQCMGMRFLTIDRSATKTCSGSTLDAAEYRGARQLMGPWGIRPAELYGVTSLTPYFHLLSVAQATQPGTYGANASWLTGEMFSFDGFPLLVTDQLVETHTNTGIYDSAGATMVAVIFNKNAFRIGQRRGITVEYDKEIWTGQISLVASWREDFKTLVETTTIKPCAMNINITAT